MSILLRCIILLTNGFIRKYILLSSKEMLPEYVVNLRHEIRMTAHRILLLNVSVFMFHDPLTYLLFFIKRTLH